MRLKEAKVADEDIHITKHSAFQNELKNILRIFRKTFTKTAINLSTIPPRINSSPQGYFVNN